MTLDQNDPEGNKKKEHKTYNNYRLCEGHSMTGKHKTLDEIIEEFNTKIEDLKPLFTYTSTGELIEDQHYTYMGEHYDESSSEEYWSEKFISTELTVSITEAISYAVRDGLDNESIANVLKGLLKDVEKR